MSKKHMEANMLTPLRNARIESSLTITQVASAVGCDPGNLSRMERGIQRPSPEVAEKLAAYFGPKLTEIQILYPERFVTTSKANNAA